MAGEDSGEKGRTAVRAPQDNRKYPDAESLRVLEKQLGRRKFLTRAAVGTFGLAAAAVLGPRVYEQATADDPNWGKPIEETEKKKLVTDLFGDNKELILRKKVTQGKKSILGYAKPGELVDAQAVYGTTYPTSSDYLGLVLKDGRSYGIWYKIDEVRVFDKAEDGTLIERKDEKGQQIKASAYVSGNFLRMPKPGEIATSGK